MIELICNQCERINEQSAQHCDRCGAPLLQKEMAQASDAAALAAADEEQTAPGLDAASNSEEGSLSGQDQDGTVTESAQAALVEEQAEEQKLTEFTDAAAEQQQGAGGAADEAQTQDLHPVVIAQPGLGHRLVPPLLAVVLTAALRYVAASASGSEGVLQGLLLPQGGWLQAAIPMAIAFLFFWSFCILALKFISMQKQLGCIQTELLQSCPRRVRDGQLSDISEQVHEELAKNSGSLVHATVYALLHNLALTDDPQRSHAFLRDLSHVNSTAQRASQRAIRVFIWSMVLLGVIGAVVGASAAAGQYAAVLTAGADSVAFSENELGQVFTQLSSAFNITLLGLTAGLVMLLLSAFVRAGETGLRKSVEQLCLQIISHARVPEPDRSLEVHVRNWFAELQQVLDSEISQRQAVYDNIAASVVQVGEDISGSVSMLEISLGNIKTVLIGELENSLRAVSSDMRSVGQEISEASENFPVHIAKAQDTFAAELDATLGNVASRFEGVGDLISGSYASLPGTLDHVQKQFADELRGQVEIQIEGLRTFGTAFSDSVTTLSSSLTEMPTQLASAGQALQESAAQVAQLKASIDAAAVSSTEHTSAAQLLARKVETLAISSEVTQQAVSSLQSLQGLMNAMQESQTKLTPMINQIAGPHEIRIVPQQKTRVAAEPEAVSEPELEAEY